MKFLNCLLGLCIASMVFSCNSYETNQVNNDPVQWPEADKLFKANPYWRGSDGAYSIKLSDDRILWLFGDTLISNIDKIEPRSPEYIKMARNSVGIQTGLNPAESFIAPSSGDTILKYLIANDPR